MIQTHFNYNCILVLKEITLEMATWVAETCWWPQYNKSTSIKLKCICWSLIRYEYSLFTFILIQNFFIIKPLYALISQIYSGMKLYMFRTVSLSIIRSSFTVHSAIVYIIQVWWNWFLTSSILVLLESCLQTCVTYTIAESTVNKLLMIDRRTVRNM